MYNLVCVVVVLLLSAFAGAQTETVVAGGVTVVELITENAAGVPVTDVLQTLVGTTTALTSTSNPLTSTSNPLAQQTTATRATTSTQQPVGPVEQTTSQAGVPYGETPYTYTTTDANGNPETLQGIFTPTGPSTVLPTPTTTGTVLGYSQWLSMVGTYTVAPNAAHRTSMSIASGWYYFVATTLAGVLGGAWLIIL